MREQMSNKIIKIKKSLQSYSVSNKLQIQKLACKVINMNYLPTVGCF